MHLRSPYLGDNLIFIISQPRSGSTLLQRVLAGHPDVHTSAETWLMLHPIYATRREGFSTEYNERWAGIAVSEFLEHYTDGPAVYDNAIREWARVLYDNALGRSGKRVFLDKTPRYYYIIEDLARLFPQASFVFLLRNPMAVLASELESYIGTDVQRLALHRDDLLLAPRRLLDGIQALGDTANVVRYESFVADPKGVIEGLCARLGLRYLDSMIEYASTPMPVGTMNDHEGIVRHVRPSTDSIDKWKGMATSSAQTRHFACRYREALGRELVESLGYSFEEMRTAFGAEPPASARDQVLPWDIAIKSEPEWTLRDRYLFDRITAIRRRGPMVGELVGAKRTLGRIVRSAAYELQANGKRAPVLTPDSERQ